MQLERNTNVGNRKMMKCPKDRIDSAMHRATVMVCPKCGRILDADELLRLLKKLGLSNELIKEIKKEMTFHKVFH